MVNFSVEQIREIMDNQDHIRNLSVIAHVDHGKSTLTDSLIAKAGIIKAAKAGDSRYMDTRQDEQDRGITIKSTGVSLYYEYLNPMEENAKKTGYLINLIDSPGHVDFSSEVTAALRVTDGALVVVDCVEGVCVQTETVLRQAMSEMIRPVVIVNKVDRHLLELKYNGEQMYQNFVRVIDMVNVIVSTYENEDMGSCLCTPDEGTVAFGSGKDQWGFTLTMFATKFSKQFKMPMKKFMEKLWGDWYYDKKGGKWTNSKKGTDGKLLDRCFVQFIMKPIVKLTNAIIDGKQKKIDKMLKVCKVELTSEEKLKEGKKLLKVVMSKWINAADAILEMFVLHLPSPRVAQKYRVKHLYEGPLTDEVGKAIAACDPNGPLCMFVSKMVPTPDYSRFYAFGRVFSGTIATGDKVRIQGSQYKPGSKHDLYRKSIQRTVLMMGRGIEPIANVPCGNTVALVGVDDVIIKCATITTYEECHNIRMMKYSVSPVVRVAVSAKNPQELPKLIKGLTMLSKSDPLVIVKTDEETQQHVIAASGELHIEICLKDLREVFAKIDIIVSDPVVSYRETVTETSSMTCLSKSPNKHNRIWMVAKPLNAELADAIEDGSYFKLDAKAKIKELVSTYGWDKNHAMRIWDYGPEGMGANIVIDATKGVQFLNDIKDHVNAGFQNVTDTGILAFEQMRNVKWEILDVNLHNDSIHRGAGQIMPTARKVMYASQIKAESRLFEPMFLAEITCPMDQMSGVYTTLAKRRGIVIAEEQVEGTPNNQVQAHLPVSESFGFTTHLRTETHGKAFPQCVFSHWEIITGDPFKEGSVNNVKCLAIRKRKGLKEVMPDFADFYDKL